MTAHLTPQQVTNWRSGVSSVEELFLLDEHLATCASCRALTGENASLTSRKLQLEFSEHHLTESQLDDYAARRPLPAEVMQHLDACAECREDADDLRSFAIAAEADAKPEAVAQRPERKPAVPIRRTVPMWARSIAAALAVAVIGLSGWLTLHRQKPADVAATSAPPVIMAANIPAAYEAEVNAALDSGSLHIPASIAALSSGRIQLRSLGGPETKQSALRVLSPLATAVVDDRPIFRWTPVENATYSIAVYDDDFREVASAAGLQGTEWQPEKPLLRGAVYRWEVKANKGAQVERAPRQTDPEARFSVLAPVDAQRLSAARSQLALSPLAMGILYADAGAVDDARRELTAAAQSNDPKQNARAEKLLTQLK